MSNQDIPAPGELPDPSDLPREPGLPDPLETFDGDPVETPTEWRERRRPEIERLFRHYVYGYVPDPPRLDATVEEREGVLEGAATLERATLRFRDLPASAPRLRLALFRPSEPDPPVVLGINRKGNHAAFDHPSLRQPLEAGSDAGDDEVAARGERVDYWQIERILDRGYAFATFHQGDVAPDRPDWPGVRRYYRDMDDPRPVRATRWGTLATWAWGFQRCVDYLVDHADLSGEVGVFGHSRRGKAALLAGATDERIGLVAPHQSGTGGCALSRGNDQETVADIDGSFPHWFDGLFGRFAADEARLPVDQHLLLALCAPRAVIDTEGERDPWANPDSALRAVREASAVYEFLGEEGIRGDGLVRGGRVDEGDVGNLVQYRLDEEHRMTPPFWDAILDFADVHLGDGG